MKHILISIIAILIISCSSQDKQNERIEKFENFLGKEKAAALTEKVDYFEERYRNLSIEEAYEKYLK